MLSGTPIHYAHITERQWPQEVRHGLVTNENANEALPAIYLESEAHLLSLLGNAMNGVAAKQSAHNAGYRK